jgi:hypothetical protein
MDTLNYIGERFGLDLGQQQMPIEIKGVGRDILPVLFKELGYTKGVEVGTFEGDYAEKLCQANPELHLCCVDPWTKYKGYTDIVKPLTISVAYEHAQAKLATYNCTLIREFSVDGAKQFPDGSLDFVYLDGNHRLPYVIEDLHAWIPKIRPGGIISGHDFKKLKGTTRIQVVEAVVAWTDAFHIRPWFVLGRTKTRPNEYRDKHRSFFWVV